MRALLDAGLLYHDGTVWRARDAVASMAVPASVQSVILSRVDRLPGETKRVLESAAVIGRLFRRHLLAEVTPSGTDLDRALGELEDRQLIYLERALPEEEYSFQHVLIQETVYHTIVRRRRAPLHRQVAAALERLHGESLQEYDEQLAHHYTEAGLVEAALPYWQRAGQRAAARSAYPEAISHLGRGLALLPSVPDSLARAQQELALQVALGQVLRAARGLAAPEAERAYARARELCLDLGGSPHLFPVLYGLWGIAQAREASRTARELSGELSAVAARQHDQEQLLVAANACGLNALWTGEVAAARTHLERALALYEASADPQQHRSLILTYGQDLGVISAVFLAWTLWLQGYTDQARTQRDRALRLAEEHRHPHSHAFCLCMAAIVRQCRGEVQAAQEEAEAVIALATERGSPLFLAGGEIVRGWTLAAQGQGEEGVALLRQGLTGWRATGAGVLQSYFLALLAEACLLAGRAEEARAAVAEGLALLDRTGERIFSAELHRLQGELRRQDADEAEVCLRQAFAIARGQGVHALELRAAASLSRLWHQQGKQADAHRLLAETYGWFSEGFDTADLQAAAALLAAGDRA